MILKAINFNLQFDEENFLIVNDLKLTQKFFIVNPLKTNLFNVIIMKIRGNLFIMFIILRWRD